MSVPRTIFREKFDSICLEMKVNRFAFLIVVVMLCNLFFGVSCRLRSSNNIPPLHRSQIPQYNLVAVQPINDTLHFALQENTYNVIKSFNVFVHKNLEFIAFYDQRSQSVSIYNLGSQNLEKVISLKGPFRGERFYKTTVYVKNFDSIFVTNNTTLYLLDSSTVIKKSIDFLKKPRFAWAVFENGLPLVLKNGHLYAGVRPYVKETSFKALKEWKVMYQFDLKADQASLQYYLPDLYRENLFGYHFLDYSYCYNNRGGFVFSFPADTNIYETNLSDQHIAYYGKSKFQRNAIEPVSKKDLENDDGSKNYLIRNSYGTIYFDPYNKRYLRVAKNRISEVDYLAKNRKKKQTLIILNEQLKIIGESSVDDLVALNSIFFTQGGSMYARINTKDEYGLHFLKLVYSDKSTGQESVSRK